ncbi:hypothetical protein [Chitinophaga sp. OAE865]|uniref:OB-fold protein n=1 Tax=Chitinophaga sp. OAE865 TaxID=2817898 RepID=UPI001AE59604
MSTTTSKHHRYRRLQLIIVSMILATIAGILLYPILKQQKDILPGIAANVYLASAPEDTSVGKCLRYPIPATELQKLYLANDQAASQKYTDETVYINGIYIGTDINPMGTAYMLLKSADRFHAIKCYLRNKEDIKIAKGSPVLLKGYCRGQIWDLKIEECELLDLPEVTTGRKVKREAASEKETTSRFNHTR